MKDRIMKKTLPIAMLAFASLHVEASQSGELTAADNQQATLPIAVTVVTQPVTNTLEPAVNAVALPEGTTFVTQADRDAEKRRLIGCSLQHLNQVPAVEMITAVSNTLIASLQGAVTGQSRESILLCYGMNKAKADSLKAVNDEKERRRKREMHDLSLELAYTKNGMFNYKTKDGTQMRLAAAVESCAFQLIDNIFNQPDPAYTPDQDDLDFIFRSAGWDRNMDVLKFLLKPRGARPAPSVDVITEVYQHYKNIDMFDRDDKMGAIIALTSSYLHK